VAAPQRVSNQGRSSEHLDKQRWRLRYAPLALAALVYAAAILTLGIAAILYLVTFPLSLLLMRKLEPPRGITYWLGVTINGALFLLVIWFLIHLILGLN
jgi:hypothetical protein